MQNPVRLTRALATAAVLLAGAGALAQPQEEVPFITTPDNVTLQMLRSANVGPRDHVLDLGSGDGRIVITAARRFGASGMGVELVPDLVARSWRSARAAGVANRVEFRVQDLFKTDLSQATVITMYLLPDVNLMLRPLLLQLKPGTRVVSHDWDMGDWASDSTVVVPVPDKQVGLEKSSKVHLWLVPAQVEGLWCGTGALLGASLRLQQSYQMLDGELQHDGAVRALRGRLQGARAQLDAADAALQLKAQGQRLQVGAASGAWSTLRGGGFKAARPTGCEPA